MKPINPCQVCKKKEAFITHKSEGKSDVKTCYECGDVVLDKEEKERMKINENKC